MAIFITPGAPGYQGPTAVGTSAAHVFNTAAAGLSAGSHDVTVVNNGPNTVYVGQSGVSATTGLPVAVGDQLTLQGPMVDVYAICAASQSAVVEAALASVISVV